MQLVAGFKRMGWMDEAISEDKESNVNVVSIQPYLSTTLCKRKNIAVMVFIYLYSLCLSVGTMPYAILGTYLGYVSIAD